MKTLRDVSLFLVILLAAPIAASAHPGVGPVTGFAHGFLHPLTGLDHILAMFAVGVWAAQCGGRATWAVPLAFVAVMLAGFASAIAGVRLGGTETMIVMSVGVLGLLIAAAARPSAWVAALIAGLFAFFHGHAHGTEMPATALGLTYAGGFVMATVALHAAGIITALSLSRALRSAAAPSLRFAGAAFAVCAVVMLVR